jgi:hypothetical protein
VASQEVDAPRAGALALSPFGAAQATEDDGIVKFKSAYSMPETIKASRRSVNARRYNRYAYGPRRYNWTYHPYWRPYQYRYWQFMYPYGGPMF